MDEFQLKTITHEEPFSELSGRLDEVAKSRSNIPIIIIDDDEIDVEALLRDFYSCGVENVILTFASAEEAIEYFKDKPQTKECIMILDLNMPGLGGFGFLEWMKRLSIPARIFVYTTSKREEDIREAYAHHVAGYVVKSPDVSLVKNFARLISLYADAVTFPCPPKREDL